MSARADKSIIFLFYIRIREGGIPLKVKMEQMEALRMATRQGRCNIHLRRFQAFNDWNIQQYHLRHNLRRFDCAIKCLGDTLCEK